jgi:hypothetical protein
MRFGRFAGLVLSLFLPAFYRDVARNWGGIGFLYILLLFIVTWIPALVKIHLGAQKFANVDFPKFAKGLPDISIKKGKVSSPVPQPLEIKDENGKVIFILDTTGKVNNLDKNQAMFLLTETKLHQRDERGNLQIHDLSQFPDFDFTAEWLQGWITTICTWLAVGLFPIFLIGSLIRALILMLLTSLVGLIVNAVCNARVSYAGLLRFGAVGMTLSVYLDTGLGLAGINVPFWFLIALVLTSGYVAVGTIVSVPPKMDLDLDRDPEPPEEPWRPQEPETGIKPGPDY